MSALSDYAENKLLDHLLGTAAFTAPSTVYIGLSTGSFADDNSGTELTGNNYARKSITCDSAASGAMHRKFGPSELGDVLGDFFGGGLGGGDRVSHRPSGRSARRELG